jgi:hypothetical protein
MARRAKTVCRKLGCNTLVETPGHCEDHQDKSVQEKGFEKQDYNKSMETKRFYSSYRWTKTSLRHRAKVPLCEECQESGIVQIAEMVHHEPPLEELLKRGLNAHDEQYLHSLCNNCHLGHLRDKKNH